MTRSSSKGQKKRTRTPYKRRSKLRKGSNSKFRGLLFTQASIQSALLPPPKVIVNVDTDYLTNLEEAIRHVFHNPDQTIEKTYIILLFRTFRVIQYADKLVFKIDEDDETWDVTLNLHTNNGNHKNLVRLLMYYITENSIPCTVQWDNIVFHQNGKYDKPPFKLYFRENKGEFKEIGKSIINTFLNDNFFEKHTIPGTVIS
jgi:hypothetical protein